MRAKTVASDLRKERKQLLSFRLRHGRIYTGRNHWNRSTQHRLADQGFDPPARQIVLAPETRSTMPPRAYEALRSSSEKSCRLVD
jgi:hypothetical protein